VVVHPQHGGRILVLTDCDQSIAEAAAEDHPGDGHRQEGGRSHQVEEEKVGAAHDRREKTGRSAQPVDVLDHLPDGDPGAQGCDREIVSAKPQQRPSDQAGEGGWHDHRTQQSHCEGEVALMRIDQHGAGVGAEAEEGDVAEGRVAGEPADQVPG